MSMGIDQKERHLKIGTPRKGIRQTKERSCGPLLRSDGTNEVPGTGRLPNQVFAKSMSRLGKCDIWVIAPAVRRVVKGQTLKPCMVERGKDQSRDRSRISDPKNAMARVLLRISAAETVENRPWDAWKCCLRQRPVTQ
jgi:hypothetical protein